MTNIGKKISKKRTEVSNQLIDIYQGSNRAKLKKNILKKFCYSHNIDSNVPNNKKFKFITKSTHTTNYLDFHDPPICPKLKHYINTITHLRDSFHSPSAPHTTLTWMRSSCQRCYGSFRKTWLAEGGLRLAEQSVTR